ncbi:histidine kinase [Variovorax sp. J2P1-59]|uniref:sensor histidine kinase n=1 Tax=Variovorax flavidus TaxID=3053501 RepID=UPI0025788A37|nr:ATP-binding protein [Variovorax sp. J2P1-59]MDM0073295.1 histidine kinase [Variovorax sp. J2P1-59]
MRAVWRLSRSRARNPGRWDFAWVLVVTVLTFVLSSTFELRERLAVVFSHGEAWQVDEVPLTLVALSLGLAWYARRRGQEAARLLAQNRELAQKLIARQDDERLALARELHDEFGQHCTAIRIEATYIQRSRSLDQIGEAARRAAASAELLQDGVRRLVRRLRPAELDQLGLVAAMQSLCEAWASRSGVPCVFHSGGDLRQRGEAIDTTIYRVTQEALANVVRHANATRVKIELTATSQVLSLSVEDDGRGFTAATPERGFGLLGATERAAALGGSFEADSAPGAGTRIRMRLPLAPELRAEAA